MRIVIVALAAALLAAGCSGSSDEPDPTATASEVSPSLDEDALRQQAEDQAVQKASADRQLTEATAEEAEAARGTVEIVIDDGKVTPQGDRVEVRVGQRITLQVTSDVDEEIHVHSDPEHTYEVPAGGSITESFVVDTPGQVAVEAHGLDVTIVQLVVRP